MVAARRLPPPARAVQERPRPAGAARAATRSSPPGTTTRSPTTSGRTAPRTTSPSEGDYGARRARAHRAYDEWMPVRMNGTAGLGDGTRLFRRLRFGTPRRAEHARPAHLPRPAGRPTSRPGRPDRGRRVSDPDRTITGREQLDWLKDSLPPAAAQWKLVGNPVMIAPVTFAELPHDLSSRSTTSPACCPATGSPTTSTSGTATPTTGARCSSTCATTGSATPSSSPATSTPAGPATCRTTPRRTRCGDSAGVEFVCTLGDLEQPQGHHRYAAAHGAASRSRRRSRPTTRT